MYLTHGCDEWMVLARHTCSILSHILMHGSETLDLDSTSRIASRRHRWGGGGVSALSTTVRHLLILALNLFAPDLSILFSQLRDRFLNGYLNFIFTGATSGYKGWHRKLQKNQARSRRSQKHCREIWTLGLQEQARQEERRQGQEIGMFVEI